MRESSPQARTLYAHFFRRFFDNDTLSFDGDTQTSVVRSISILAVPGLMVAFWLTPHYPSRPMWAAAADHYFFVLYSFVAMGCVATFEWDMLFPDRSDFLVLLPLPLKLREIMFAKARALASFLSLFLLATNVFGMLLLPAISGGSYWRHAFSHFIAVSLAGGFAALSTLALEALAICFLNESWQRFFSPLLQALLIACLLLMLLLFPLCGAFMPRLLDGHSMLSSFIPPFWFLGLYEHLVLGGAAEKGAALLAPIGIWATALATLVVLVTYPLAWARRRRQAIEGGARPSTTGDGFLSALLHRTLLRRPEERAVFHFVSQTIPRKSRYQVYLAMYCGAGLALALSCVLTFRLAAGHVLIPTLSDQGLHAVLPLLLFWLVVGLRAAFAFPVDMAARWIFPMNQRHSGAHAKAAKIWVLMRCVFLIFCVLCLLRVIGWDIRHLVVQAVCGISISLLLTDIFFFSPTAIPFTQPRLPGRTSLPLMLTLYIAVFPPFVLWTLDLERWMETRFAIVAWVLASVAALHFILTMARKSSAHRAPPNVSTEENEGILQTLRLTP
jgi:hypothetical protein